MRLREQLGRWYLPFVQVALATALLVSNLSRPSAAYYQRWARPDAQLSYAINAPAGMLRAWLMGLAEQSGLPTHSIHWIEMLVQTVLYILMVFLLWYFVSIELSKTPDRGSSLTRLTPIRGIADLLLIFIGIGIGYFAVLVQRQFGPVSVYSILVSVPYFVWSMGLVSFYCYDLWIYCRAGRLRR